MRITVSKNTIALFICLMLSGSASATVMVQENDESIIQRSQYVMTGTVEGIDNLLEKNSMPFQYISFRIEKIYKNNTEAPLLQDGKIVIRQIGGTVNGRTLDVGGLTKFVEGSKMLLSISVDEATGYYYVIGNEQGSYYMLDNDLINDTRDEGMSLSTVGDDGEVRIVEGEVRQITLQQMEEKIQNVAADEAERLEE